MKFHCHCEWFCNAVDIMNADELPLTAEKLLSSENSKSSSSCSV